MRRAITFLVSFTTGLFFTFLSYGANFNVSMTGDRVSGQCNPNDCSLREAIMAANADGEDSEIELGEGVFKLTLAGKDNDNGQTGDLDITDPHVLTISGISAEKTIIDASDLGDRIIDLCPGVAGTCVLNLKNLTLQNGNAGNENGGAILSVSEGKVLNISHCRFLENQAANGGAIWVQHGSASKDLNIDNSVFSQNKASGDGGAIGIKNDVAFAASHTAISQNTAGGNGGGIYASNNCMMTFDTATISQNGATLDGGGIWSQAISQILMTNSTVSKNNAGGNGGGIWGDSSATPVINNSTLSNNVAKGSGGGISDTKDSFVRINNSTLSGNQATTGGALSGSDLGLRIHSSTLTQNSATQGGGLYLGTNISHSDLANSILAGNTGGSNGTDCFNGGGGTIDFTSFHNVYSDVSSCFTNLGPGDKNNIASSNLGLGPLADNGGPTQTHALLPGSPALDNGDPATGCKDDSGNQLEQDQRGQSRKLGAGCDSGSVEAGNANLEITGSANPEPVVVNAGLTYSFTVKNEGPDKSFDSKLTDILPSGATYVSAMASAGSCDQESGTVTCHLGSLAAGSSETVYLVVTPTTAGTMSNTASLVGSEIDVALNNNALSTNSTVNASNSSSGGGSGCGLVLKEGNENFLSLGWWVISLLGIISAALRRQGNSRHA
jgi:uncharacterized repeat protein (TIGR01451 family)